MTKKPSKPAKLFVGYAHKDESYWEELQGYLKPLKVEGLVEDWHDHDVTFGQEQEGVVTENLEMCQIVLFLISINFIASPYSYGADMERALEKHEAGEARVIPVILRPVYWSDSPIARLQPLPSNGKPIATWPNRDEAWLEVATGIRREVEDSATGRS